MEMTKVPGGLGLGAIPSRDVRAASVGVWHILLYEGGLSK